MTAQVPPGMPKRFPIFFSSRPVIRLKHPPRTSRGAAVAATYEALLIGEQFGLDPELMTDVINASTGRSFASELVVKEHALTGKFASGFAMGLLAKDVRIAADLAADIGVRSPYTNLTRDEFARGRDKVGFARDFSELLLVMKEEKSG